MKFRFWNDLEAEFICFPPGQTPYSVAVMSSAGENASIIMEFVRTIFQERPLTHSFNSVKMFLSHPNFIPSFFFSNRFSVSEVSICTGYLDRRMSTFQFPSETVDESYANWKSKIKCERMAWLRGFWQRILNFLCWFNRSITFLV